VLDQDSITTLPSDVSDSDAVALPIIALIPWLALAEYAPISSSTVIFLHNASTRKFVANHSRKPVTHPIFRGWIWCCATLSTLWC
jgi:hypothetical protein